MKKLGAVRVSGKWVACQRGQKVCAVIAPTCVQMEIRVRTLLNRDVVFYSGGRPTPRSAA